MFIEYIKIITKDLVREIQLSNEYNYSVTDGILEKEPKKFNTNLFHSKKFHCVTAFVGANGSGKSRLIYYINNILSGDKINNDIQKYLIVFKSKEDMYYIGTYKFEILNSDAFKYIEINEFSEFVSRAIYTNVVDGNAVFTKNVGDLIDLSMNYQLFKKEKLSNATKDKMTFNQILLLCQNPNLLNDNGIDNLKHPKEVIFEPNLEFLNKTFYQNLFGKYLIYIKIQQDENLYNDTIN